MRRSSLMCSPSREDIDSRQNVHLLCQLPFYSRPSWIFALNYRVRGYPHALLESVRGTAMHVSPYVSIIAGFALAALLQSATGADSNDVLINQDRAMPSDIDPQSGFRLPLTQREELDEAGR